MIATSSSTTTGDCSSTTPPAHRGLGRLGAWAGSHLRAVLLIWLGVLILFGVFAPKVESSLAGAGWEDSTSQSVAARNLIQRDFAGLGASALQVVVVDHNAALASDPTAQTVLAKVTGHDSSSERIIAEWFARLKLAHRALSPVRVTEIDELPSPECHCRLTGKPESSLPAPRRTPTPWSWPPSTSPDRFNGWGPRRSRSP